MKSLLFVAAMLTLAWAGCPEYKSQDPFSIDKFSGTWYRQYSQRDPQMEGTCITSDFTWDEVTGRLNTRSTMTDFSGEKYEEIGTLSLANPSCTDGTLTLRLQSDFGDQMQNVSVLATDYEHYAIMYTCSQSDYSDDINEQFWVMTHCRTLTPEVDQLIHDSLKTVSDNGGPCSPLIAAIQDNCS